MKILIVNTYYYPNMVGGTEQSVKLLAEGFANKGHQVYVLTCDRDKVEEEIINGVNVIRLDLSRKSKSIVEKVIRKCFEYNNIKIKDKVIEIIDKINPDVIHTNNLFYLSPIIWKIASDKGVKVVHTLRDYWGLCPKCTLLDRNLNICNKKRGLCKVHTLNYKKFSKYVDVVTAPSNFTLDLYTKNGLFSLSKKQMISNAIDIDFNKYYKTIEERKKNNSKIINYLFIGALDDHKGVKFLIETFMKIDNTNLRLTLCGQGSLEEYVNTSCKLDKRISYLGPVFGNKKEKIIRQSDVIIVPSIWYEPFGRVVIEGYKNGLVVIACKIGGIRELLNDDISIGIDINNKQQLHSAILKLNNRDMIKKYINSGDKYLKIYDLESQMNSFIQIYK